MQRECRTYPGQPQGGQRPAGRLQGCSGAAGAAAGPRRLQGGHPGRSQRPSAAAGAACWWQPCCSSQQSVGQGLAAAVRRAALLLHQGAVETTFAAVVKRLAETGVRKVRIVSVRSVKLPASSFICAKCFVRQTLLPSTASK